MKRKQSGFSLIELMVVIALLAIFASLAMPSFRDSIVRARLNNAQDLVVRTLKQAKNIAKAHTTMVRIQMASGSRQITMTAADGVAQTIDLPQTIEVTNDVDFDFTSRGMLAADTEVEINQVGNAANKRSIDIAVTGKIVKAQLQ